MFEDLGLTMSTAINMFLKSAVANDGIPFTVSRQKINATTKAALDEYDEMKKIQINIKDMILFRKF